MTSILLAALQLAFVFGVLWIIWTSAYVIGGYLDETYGQWVAP